MADVKKTMEIEVSAQDKTTGAFSSVGKNVKKLSTDAETLGSSLKKIGGAIAGYFAVGKIADFVKSTTEDALAQAKVMDLLNASIVKIGASFEESRKEIDAYTESMANLGREDTETSQAISKLLIKTNNVEQALKLTTLASDLAASGLGTYSENVDALGKVLIGKGARALLAFGVQVKDNATVTEQLDAIQKRVTQTTEQWATTTEGQISRARAQWAKMKEDLGAFGAITLVNLSNSFANFYNQTGGASKSFGKILAEIVNVWLPVTREKLGNFAADLLINVTQIENIGKILNSITGGKIDWLKNLSNISENIDKQTNKTIEDTKKNFEKQWADLQGDSADGTQAMIDDLGEYADAASSSANKVKIAFENIGKTIVSKMEDSIKKIKDLRKEINDLASDTEEALRKQGEAYEQDLANLARTSQGKIDTIDDQIDQEMQEQSKGWRTRIAKLEEDKKKEQSILDRLNKEGIQAQAEAEKDELTLIQESNAKKIEEIKSSAEIARLEKEKAILEYQVGATQAAISVTSPGGVESLVSGEVAKNPWSTSQVENIFNINVGGDIVSEDNLLKKVVAVLNRLSELKQYSGQ